MNPSTNGRERSRRSFISTLVRLDMWALIGCLYVITFLPLKAQYAFGRVLVRVAAYLFKRRTQVLRINLEICFPNLSEADRAELARKNIDSYGEMFMEHVNLYLGKSNRIIARGNIENPEVLQEAIDIGRGCLIAGIHFTSLDTAASIVKNAGFDFASITRKQRNPVLDYLADRYRRNTFGSTKIFDLKSIVTAVRELAPRRLNLWLAVDQDMGRRKYPSTVFVNFFNQPASTVTSIARIAARIPREPTPIVLMSHHRDPNTKGTTVRFDRVDNLPTGNWEQDAQTMNNLIEERIEEHPEQWFWVHRRFKSIEKLGDIDPYQARVWPRNVL